MNVASRGPRARADSWFRRFARTAPADVRLLCFPHAGGGASGFLSWQSLLPPWLDLVRVQLPGREDRWHLPALADARDIVEGICEELVELLDVPVVIYGHSLGALLAFETVRELRRARGVSPLALVVSGRRAPQCPPRVPLHGLGDDALMEVLRQMGGTSPKLLLDERWRGRYMPMIRADLTVSDAYRHEPERPLDCAIHAYLGTDDHLIDRCDWEAWSEQTSAAFERGLFPGNHFFSAEGQAALVSRIVDIVSSRLLSPIRAQQGRQA